MKVNIKQLHGNWNLGYSLDKHTLRSIYVGDDRWGNPQFNTTRTEVGEALYQLKYNNDLSKVEIISSQIYNSLARYFPRISFIVPMPASKQRRIQPVIEICRNLSKKMRVPCNEQFLIKTGETTQMKNLDSKEDKIENLMSTLSLRDNLSKGRYRILLVDDLYDTGASLEAASTVFRNFGKIDTIYVATVTRKR